MIAELVRITRSAVAKLHGSPGQTVNVKAVGLGGAGVEAEMVHPPGVFSRPPRGARGFFIPLGQRRRYGFVIGGMNYSLTISVEEGETVIYSTDAAGALKASIKLDAAGNIELNGNSKRLVTWDELESARASFMTALNLHTHPTAATGPPSAPAASMTFDITAAKTATLKTGG